MSLTEQTIISKIEVLEDNTVQIRSTRQILENSEIIAENHHRYVLTQGDDISSEPQKVKDVCNAIWV